MTSDVELTYITPYRGPVKRVVVPDDRIGELVKASQPCPNHIETGTGVGG